MGDKVEGGEFLENANRISGTENGDRAGEADVSCARGGCSQNHDGGGVEELGPVMFADAENVEADLVSELHLFQ